MDVQFCYRRQEGISLIEVLVAFFVLSFGMLGIAGLHLTSLRDNGSALHRTHAIVLAGDIIDRIRANTKALASYAITDSGQGTDNDCRTDSGGVAAACSPQELAADDLFDWKALVSEHLPDAEASITITPDGTVPTLNTIVVRVEWTDGVDAASFSTTTQIWP